jgi:RHS repeat-associated protein
MLAAVLLLPCLGTASASVTASIAVGGSEQSPGGAWDSSAITVAFNGFTETAHYGQYSSAASVASALAAMFSRDYLQDGLCAMATGNVVNIKLKNGQPFSPVVITDPNTSFSLTPSGFPALSGGTPDQGTVTLWVTTPGGQVAAASTLYEEGSTAASVAAELAQSVAPGSPVRLTAVDTSLYIEAKSPGAASNYAYSLATASSVFPTPSFASTPPSGNLTGGSDPAPSTTTTPVYSYSITGYAANSNLLRYTDSVMGAWSFNYDQLNRLTGATLAPALGGNTTLAWTYDSFGNRLTQAGNGGMNIVSQFANDAAGNPHNQVTQTNARGVTSLPQYDAAGEMQSDGANAYLYDAEGRVCAVAAAPIGGIANMTGYLYNAVGKRVAKGTISSFSCNMMTNGFTATNEFVLGQGGEQLSELARDENGTMAWQHTNVYAAGVLMASYDNNGTHFLLNDWLGTRRAQTDYAGVMEQTCSSLPFGDGLTCTGSLTAPTEHHFTGKERDTESGNDYMFARYYNSATGRFLSPDWSAKVQPVPYAKLDDPQSLNLYSYVRNNPLSRVDADGHCDSSAKATTNTACHKVSDLQLTGGYTQQLKNAEGVKGSGGKPIPAYTDVGDGRHTVGWGHVDNSVPLETKVGEKQAQQFFDADSAKGLKAVKDVLGSNGNHEWSYGEFTALVDLTYQAGTGILTEKSSPNLMKAINAGDYDAGSKELRATRINGEPAPPNMLQGMENRSDMRQDIWNGKDPTN